MSNDPEIGFATHDEFLSVLRSKVEESKKSLSPLEESHGARERKSISRVVRAEESPRKVEPQVEQPNSEEVSQNFVGTQVYEPLNFVSAYQFMLTYCDEFELYPWQIEELHRLSGYDFELEAFVQPSRREPVQYNLCAVNGSGKDNIIIAGFILWFLTTKVHGQVRLTSRTALQVDEQSFAHCKYFAEKINNSAIYGEALFEIKHGQLYCPKTDAKAIFFVTNEAGRAEGFHAKFGQPFAVIINEAKSIPDDLFGGFSRYTGWNYWIEISSTGMRQGHFYRRCIDPETIQYPANLVLGKLWCRRIKATDCPHIMDSPARIKDIVREGGVNSLVYKSAIDCEFSDGVANDILIRASATEYGDPVPDTYGFPMYCGVDLSLGGDETVVSIWQGNHRVAQITLQERYEPTLHFRLIEIFKEYDLDPDNIIGDAGGLGKPIIQRLADNGWPIGMFNFGGSARNKSYCLNRGAEMWCVFKRVVEDKLVVLPRDDYKFLEQLTTRRYDTLSGKIKLESKEEVRLRGEPSPDRPDAAVMAWSLYDLDLFFDKAKPGAKKVSEPTRGFYREEPVVDINRIQQMLDQRIFNEGHVTSNQGKPRRGGFLCKMLGLR